MTDREMLELAAKAVGYEYEYTDHTGHGEFEQHQIRNEQGCLVDWNPLEDEEEKTFSVSRWRESRYPAGGFWVSMEPQDYYFEPTHWMPLPPLPEVKK